MTTKICIAGYGAEYNETPQDSLPLVPHPSSPRRQLTPSLSSVHAFHVFATISPIMRELKIYGGCNKRSREFVDDHAGTIDSSVIIAYAQKVVF